MFLLIAYVAESATGGSIAADDLVAGKWSLAGFTLALAVGSGRGDDSCEHLAQIWAQSRIGCTYRVNKLIVV